MEDARRRWRTTPELWSKLKDVSQQMRTDPTPEEDLLWNELRNRQLAGMKFRRQHATDRFVVDFYCPKAALVVEVDGAIHEYTREQDAVRQEFLESLGLKVVRVTNDQVRRDMQSVLRLIVAAVETEP